MYVTVPTQKSCSRAWVAASTEIIKQKDEGYNVIIDVDDPVSLDDSDNEVIKEVDLFLTRNDKNPISTVCNTIFPKRLYERYGRPRFYEEYHKAYSRLTCRSQRWGRYFDRLTRHTKIDGTTYNPLEDMIEKLRSSRSSGQNLKAAFELAVYDPLYDGRSRIGGQCLSFLSLKCHPSKGLMLTAVYRNHYYISRCLGNLIGLGRLQAFIAQEAGLPVGSLTCISTHAIIDTDVWTITDARALVVRSQKILANSVLL